MSIAPIPPGYHTVTPYLVVADCAAALDFYKRAFGAEATFAAALAAGATAVRPMENCFWGDRMGRIADPFGHHWSLGTHVEDVEPDEMERRFKAMMGG